MQFKEQNAQTSTDLNVMLCMLVRIDARLNIIEQTTFSGTKYTHESANLIPSVNIPPSQDKPSVRKFGPLTYLSASLPQANIEAVTGKNSLQGLNSTTEAVLSSHQNNMLSDQSDQLKHKQRPEPSFGEANTLISLSVGEVNSVLTQDTKDKSKIPKKYTDNEKLQIAIAAVN